MKKLLAMTRIYHLAGDRSTEEDMAAVLSLAGCAYRLYRTASRKRWKRQGGIVIKVDVKTGQLKKYGIMQYPQGRIFMEHPLTKTKFSDFQIPFWQEVRETAEKAQRVFHQVKLVGTLRLHLKGRLSLKVIRIGVPMVFRQPTADC